jgi:hypothetical protein
VGGDEHAVLRVDIESVDEVLIHPWIRLVRLYHFAGDQEGPPQACVIRHGERLLGTGVGERDERMLKCKFLQGAGNIRKRLESAPETGHFDSRVLGQRHGLLASGLNDRLQIERLGIAVRVPSGLDHLDQFFKARRPSCDEPLRSFRR